MYVSRVKSQIVKFRKQRICQGDILRDLEFAVGGPISKTEGELEEVDSGNYWIVMTQDCDLSQDYKQRQVSVQLGANNIRSILLCPAYPAWKFYNGTHIDNWQGEVFSKKLKDRIAANDQYKRYHYVKGDSSMGVPELVIDFKHFFTAPVEVVYKQRKAIYLATIGELYREELSQRFANFLSRIGLPDAV